MASRKYMHLNADGRRRELVKLLEETCPSSMHRRDFFNDCIEMWAITVSNRLAGGYKFDEREARFLKIEKKYDRKTVTGISQAFGLFQIVTAEEGGDVLGDVYQGLNIQNTNAGQFFTPSVLSVTMNAMLLVDAAKDLDERRKAGTYFDALDPAIGAGSTLIATADWLDQEKVPFRDVMRFDGVDIDLTCVYMAYLQLATRGVSAIVRHGNSITMEMWDAWITPLYAQQLCAGKLAEKALIESVPAPEPSKATVQLSLLDEAS